MVVAAAKVAADRVRWPDELDREDAPRIIHEYLRTRIRYFAEPPSSQRVRLPSGTVKERVADCKSTAVFLASSLRAAGWTVKIRFIRQRGTAKGFNHVYVVADGIPVDPLLPLGREALYLAKKDIPI
jgi:transglutaminase-like putative cysteine protease